MGNEVSHKRYCWAKSRQFEKLATVQENTGADLSVAQAALGAEPRSSVEHPPKEKLQDTGMQDQDTGKAAETASSSLPVAQVMVRTAELQALGEAQPSAEQSEEPGDQSSTPVSLDTQACAPAQGSPATALQTAGDAGSAPGLPLQTATGTGAEGAADVVIEQTALRSSSALRKKPRDKLYKPSPLCRWLKQLRSSAENTEVKSEASASQE